MSCNQCGKCCEAIILSLNIDEVKAKIGYINDAQFIVNNWIPIEREVAIKINPNVDVNKAVFFYKCLKYDPINRNCSDYENRPNVCKNYPFYVIPNQNAKEIDGIVKLHPNFLFYSDNCGFKKFASTIEEWNKEYEILKDTLL